MQSSNDILFRNFDVFSHSEKNLNNFKSLIFKLALQGKLNFQKLSEGRIKKPLQALVEEQKAYLKRQGILFEEQPNSPWPIVELGKLLDYEQPTNYIVNSTNYKDEYKTPVLTAGKSFLLGWTNEKTGIFPKEKLPVIIFDDFTTATKFVDFLFKVKSSAMKILHLSNIYNSHESSHSRESGNPQNITKEDKNTYIKFIFYIMQSIEFDTKTHKRYWISQYSKIKIPLPPLAIQKEIVALMEKCTLLETQIKEKSQKQKEFSKSSMHFITQAQDKKETAYHWEFLKNNFKDILYSESGAKQFKAMAFQLCLKGKLNFQKLSTGRIQQPLQTLVEEQKQYLKKQGRPFDKQLDSPWPIVELGESLEKIKYTNKIKKSNFLKKGVFPIIDQSENFISGYWNNQKDVFKVNSPIIIFGDHTCCFKYIDFDFVLGADGVKIIQPKKHFFPFFLYYLLLNTKLTNLGYSRHFKSLKKIKIPLPPLAIQKEIVSLMEYAENIEKQIQKEKNLSLQLSQSLSYHL